MIINLCLHLKFKSKFTQKVVLHKTVLKSNLRFDKSAQSQFRFLLKVINPNRVQQLRCLPTKITQQNDPIP